MGKLIYTGIMSLDGFIEDSSGGFDWSMPDEEVHAFVNAHESSIGTYLYGRRLYEVMKVWETLDTDGDDQPDVVRDYATLWRAADKVVYSTSLSETTTSRTRLVRDLDVDSVRGLKELGPDVSVGGANLAAQLVAEGLVDEFHVFLNPIAVGGGKPFWPQGVRTEVELLDAQKFSNGVVFLRYGVATPSTADRNRRSIP